MLKKMASDALGLSDIGKIIDKSDFNKVDSDDYIMNEDGESIFFIIKSRSDEYCFTNLALIHIDGASAMSKKRLVSRYDYYKNPITDVQIETAGTIDLDCEIKFTIGGKGFSIDVNKNQIEQLKDLYKSLYRIGCIIEENNLMLQKSEETLAIAAKACASSKTLDGDASEIFKNINEYSFNWVKANRENYVRKDFTDVFKNYINN